MRGVEVTLREVGGVDWMPVIGARSHLRRGNAPSQHAGQVVTDESCSIFLLHKNCQVCSPML